MNAEEIRQDLHENFIRYCEIDSGSVEDTGKVPSTPEQRKFAEFLAEEASAMGYQPEFYDGGLIIRVESNTDKEIPNVLYASHLDTTPEAPNKGVKVLVHKNYDGNDITLTAREEPVVISTKNHKGLEQHVGDTLYTSDGRTLLGGDDKSGIAGIMTFLKYLHETGEEHGAFDVIFSYDEETGLDGMAKLDTSKDTNAVMGFLFDCGYGEIGTETFNAASAHLPIKKVELEEEVNGKKVTIKVEGIYTFPGHAKGVMVDPYRTIPAVVEALEEKNVAITNLSWGGDGITLEVIAESEEDLAGLSEIRDKRFKDQAKAENPVTFQYSKEDASTQESYDLAPLVKLVNGIPYEISAEQTEGKVGYIQPLTTKLNEDGTIRVRTLIRDHDEALLEDKKELIRIVAPTAKIETEYMNMGKILKENPYVLEIGENAMRDAGIPVERIAIRGGDESSVLNLSIETITCQPGPHGRRIPSVNMSALGYGCHTVEESLPQKALVGIFNTALNINRQLVKNGPELMQRYFSTTTRN